MTALMLALSGLLMLASSYAAYQAKYVSATWFLVAAVMFAGGAIWSRR